MMKQTAGNISVNRIADAALAASRQVWLAGLGAAVVTREWVRKDAGHMFRALIKEGSTVESQAIRVLGRSIESSIALVAPPHDAPTVSAALGDDVLFQAPSNIARLLPADIWP